MPPGAAQGAHYPAGTRGDIQAVTYIFFKFEYLTYFTYFRVTY